MLLRIFSLLSLFAFPNLLLSEPIHFRAKLMCDEISAKSFSVNGEISNVAMDGEGLIAQVEVEEKDGKRSNYLTTKSNLTTSSRDKLSVLRSKINDPN